MRTLIKGGTVVTASETFAADVLIEDERVVALGELSGKLEADRTVEARDKLVLPGGIDVHTHIEMPFGGSSSVDDWTSGTIGAACGGTTSVVDFAIQPQGGGLREGLYLWHQKAEGKAVIDYAFHMIVREVTPRSLIEMDAMVKEEGVSSFKLFTAYPGVFMVDDASIFRAMLKTGENGGLICMHAENGGAIDVLIQRALAQGHTAPKYHALTRPMRLEDEATNRVIALAEVAEVPVYIVHLSASDAMLRVREARDRGIPAFAETCPQYLFLSYANYEEPGFDGAKYVMSPPLRPAGNEEQLWRGLANDDLQVVSTDHCPFCMKDAKLMGKDDFSKIPNGAPGIETRMPLLFDAAVARKRLSLNRMVEISSTAPAKIMGLYPRKGTIAPGADADVVIFDPKKETTLSVGSLHGKADYTPYEGRKVQGAIEMVLRRGEVIVVGNKYVGKGGGGRFIKRGPITLK